MNSAHIKTIARNTAAFVVGVLIGSMVNMSLISVGGQLVPPPPGVDVSNMESLRAGMHLFEAKHFLFPFLAHAVGTFAGACIAALLAATHRMRFALAVGVMFLVGGIASAFMLPAPMWFITLDLVGAYLTMGWLAGRLVEKIRFSSTPA